jgi:hypothetical protein
MYLALFNREWYARNLRIQELYEVAIKFPSSIILMTRW